MNFNLKDKVFFEYDLFLFDLDGTLINTEFLHLKAYNEAFAFYKIPIDLNFNEYCKYAHQDDKELSKFVSSETQIPWEKIYLKKKDIFLDLIETNLEFNEGAEFLLETLFKEEKETCIVTHSDKDVLNKVLQKLPLIGKMRHFITKDNYTKRKPHPECYIKALQLFPECKNPIGFEDSLKGFLSLKQTSITSVFMGTEDYFYFPQISPENHFPNFNLINWQMIKTFKINKSLMENFVEDSINKIKDAISKCKSNFLKTANLIMPLLKSNIENINITGIGKSAEVAKKSVATWQSLGIPCYFKDIPNSWHGNFGVLKDNDIVIYISNSGNSKEIVEFAKYIKKNFNILQICLALKPEGEMKKLMNFYFTLIDAPIFEFDSLNMIPSTSCLIFMSFLDIIGIKLAEEKGLTIEKFQLAHPGGDLGKKSRELIDRVVIVASGLGTRLFPLTKYIPKIGVTVNNKPVIESLIEFWQKKFQKKSQLF
jgi:HAD superfamily hydrolase (TIGR01509 family)